MSNTLTGLIEAHQQDFSKGQRRIAAFITDHYDQAAFMTASRLGDEVGVSESTVVRFATQLGFDGYPGLQKAVQEMIRRKLTIVQRLDVTRSRMEDDRVLERVATGDMQNIRRTLEQLDPRIFDRTVNLITEARQIYVFGAGSCKALASFFTHYLQMLLGGKVHIITAASQSEIFEEMLDICARDVVIGISFPRYSTKAVNTLHYAHSRGADIIAITDSPLSPIATYAGALLIAHSDIASVVDSLVAPMSVINALLVAISLRTVEQTRPKLEELERLWLAYGVYQPEERQEDTP